MVLREKYMERPPAMDSALLNMDIIKALSIRDDLRFLVTDHPNRSIPIYRWYNYKHSFSKDLVIELFKAFSFEKKSKKMVLDPFCGAGTTLLAAKEYGLEGIGIDVMPFPAFISEAKTANYDVDMLRDRYARLMKHLTIYGRKPVKLNNKRALLNTYFSKEILDWALYVYSWISHQPDRPSKLFFMTALFSILENISQMKKDGGFLRKFPREIDVESAQKVMVQQIETMLRDVESNIILGTIPTLVVDDVRRINTEGHLKIEHDSVDAIITSPPYPNRHDYTRIDGLESILGFSNNAQDIKIVRYNTLRSHVEARKSLVCGSYKSPARLEQTITSFDCQSLPNKEIVPMLRGYFEDMYSVFLNLYPVLKTKGFFALVVCDVRYGGVVVPVGELINECAVSAGFTLAKKIIARSKNNSSQQMRRFGKKPIGEYIFIWQK